MKNVEFDLEQLQDIVEEYRMLDGGLLPLLHAIQDRFGHIPDGSVSIVAQALNLSRAEVHGVISFYHHFEAQPGGEHCIEICRAEACQARGSRMLEQHACERLDCDFGETTADGRFTLRPVYCLGLCATGPSMAIDGRPYSRVSTDRFDTLLERDE
jgi:formate dehydrogenase subunit gamma